MSVLELFILAVGLSMDAFAVAVCKGLASEKAGWGRLLIVGAWFGGFQALMPAIGWLLGSRFINYIAAFDHWVAFVLLAVIGFNMIRESCRKDEECDPNAASLSVRVMLPLAVATSIDALAVGVTFAFLRVNILYAVIFIGCTTFILSAIGVKVGSIFGAKYKAKAEIVGGVILILLGVKILLEHLGVIRF